MTLFFQKLATQVSILCLCAITSPLFAQSEYTAETFFYANDTVIYALYDSLGIGIDKALTGVKQTEIQRLIKQSRTKPAVNVFLVSHNDNLILIDTGYGLAGKAFNGGLMFKTLNDLASIDKINTILLTHLHPDHIGALLKEGKAQFPNATIYVSEKELAYWNNDKNITNPALKDIFDLARTFQRVYKVVAVKPNQKILSDFTVIEEYGHTPGHVGYLLNIKPQKILFWGDIIHHIDLQIKNPDIYLTFDVDGKQAIETRKRILSWVVKNKFIVAGAHLPFPGVIRITKGKDNQYQYRPEPPFVEEGC